MRQGDKIALISLVAGFTVWSVGFVALYGLQALGCAYGWPTHRAVLILAYEWRRQSGQAETLPFGSGLSEVAPKSELVGLFEHLEGVLDQTGFFTTPEKKPSMVHNLRTALTRGNFSSQEIRTLRGVISSIDRRHERPNPNRQKKN